ncbi:MAG: hotdog family protein [Desulfurivibrionaceae bacterium]
MWYSFVETEAIKLGKDEIAARVTTDGQSPWFSGHFPDNPILPGIAQLKMVADIIAASREDDAHMTGLSRIKFRKIVRPGELLDIHATAGLSENQYAFRITSSTEEVCSGMMLFAKKR